MVVLLTAVRESVVARPFFTFLLLFLILFNLLLMASFLLSFVLAFTYFLPLLPYSFYSLFPFPLLLAYTAVSSFLSSFLTLFPVRFRSMVLRAG